MQGENLGNMFEPNRFLFRLQARVVGDLQSNLKHSRSKFFQTVLLTQSGDGLIAIDQGKDFVDGGRDVTLYCMIQHEFKFFGRPHGGSRNVTCFQNNLNKLICFAGPAVAPY